MSEKISVNMTEVAKPFRLPLNLQLFAEGEPASEPAPTPAPVVKDQVYTSAAEHAEATSAKEPVVATQEPLKEEVQSEIKEEVKPIQNDETNAAFAEMRRKAEAAELKATQLEQQQQRTMEIARKFGPYGVFSDEDVARTYGQSHNVHTLDQLEREIQRQEYVKQGVDPDLVEKIVTDKLENHPSVVQARKLAFDNLLVSNYNELLTEFKDVVTKPEDVSPEVWAKWNEGQSGLSLSDAYALVNRKTLAEKQQAATKQAALNQLNSKSHMKANEGSSEELETGSIPDEVMEINRRMFARELKAGTMTEKTIIQHYLRHNKK
jgi:hypothetical protein